MFIAPEEVVKFGKYFKEKGPNLEYFINLFYALCGSVGRIVNNK